MKISWTSSKIRSQTSEISGTGVYALESISEGERIAVFGGYVVQISELDIIKEKFPSQHKTILDIGIQVDEDLIFSPINEGQFSHIEYLNHSCDPNAGFENQLHLVAIRSIEAGDEISMDYATCITSDIFAMDCSCNTQLCRNHVTGEDWKDVDLQKKYRGHFQPYIEKLILKINKK